MTTTTDITSAAAALGRKGGSAKSEAKTAAVRANGALGGRPVTFWIASLYESNGLALDCPSDAAWGYGHEDEWIDAISGSALFKTKAAAEKAAKKSIKAFEDSSMYYTLTKVSRDEAKAEFDDAEI